VWFGRDTRPAHHSFCASLFRENPRNSPVYEKSTKVFQLLLVQQ
jgi:hypothetical protein